MHCATFAVSFTAGCTDGPFQMLPLTGGINPACDGECRSLPNYTIYGNPMGSGTIQGSGSLLKYIITN